MRHPCLSFPPRIAPFAFALLRGTPAHQVVTPKLNSLLAACWSIHTLFLTSMGPIPLELLPTLSPHRPPHPLTSQSSPPPHLIVPTLSPQCATLSPQLNVPPPHLTVPTFSPQCATLSPHSPPNPLT
ncbi:unnamed protein product [Closterium sp. Naga37s-1]|nr:unnamed protein product [Closterium sp. Naga37s-1]